MTTLFRRFWMEDDGATTIEYGLMAAFLSVVVIGAFGAFADQLAATLDKIATTIADATG